MMLVPDDQLRTLTLAWMGLAVSVWVLLGFISAPYGRHHREGWGPTVPARVSWVLMETPSLVIMAAMFLAAGRFGDPVPWVFVILWCGHYLNRSFIYPFRMGTGGRPMPVVVVLMGVGFNGINAWLNGEVLFHRSPILGSDWLTDPRFLVGLALFALGMALHLDTDHRLMKLKRQGRGYQVPTGGMFRWVSCPNYLGEIVQWTGWAMATWSLPGLAFALWTVANLAPRARTHHRWYRERFEDYPPERRPLVPRFYRHTPRG